MSLTEDLHERVLAEKRLASELERHAGEWVAVREHEVVASADSLEALLDEVDPEEVESVFRVPEDQHTVCFY